VFVVDGGFCVVDGGFCVVDGVGPPVCGGAGVVVAVGEVVGGDGEHGYYFFVLVVWVKK
jgi:hypothetical protein